MIRKAMMTICESLSLRRLIHVIRELPIWQGEIERLLSFINCKSEIWNSNILGLLRIECN
jgi:hypothetical protein